MAAHLSPFVHGVARDSSEASDSVARKIWLLLELLRHKLVRFDLYHELHARDKRSFQRDLQQLRAIGKGAGFTISKIEEGGIARLVAYDAQLRRLDDARAPFLLLLGEVARALGEPIQGEFGKLAETAPDGEVFLHVQAPKLAEGSHVANVYEKLKDAWASRAGRALVRFRYRASASGIEERTVEPYRILVRSGRYYLFAFDQQRKDWRFFALDAIVGMPAKAGTIIANRVPPEGRAGDDVIGFIKSSQKSKVRVVVELSANVATSATSRIWQHEQVVEKQSGGRARITFTVSDPSEVIRWAFGFGGDARIVAPPACVKAARESALRLVKAHATESV